MTVSRNPIRNPVAVSRNPIRNPVAVSKNIHVCGQIFQTRISSDTDLFVKSYKNKNDFEC